MRSVFHASYFYHLMSRIKSVKLQRRRISRFQYEIRCDYMVSFLEIVLNFSSVMHHLFTVWYKLIQPGTVSWDSTKSNPDFSSALLGAGLNAKGSQKRVFK